MRRAVLGAVGALAVASPATHAAYAPHVDLTVPGAEGPGRPAALSTTITQAQGEEATRTVEATLPGTFGFNAAFAARGCPAADEQAGRCPASSRIGTVAADSSFGSATGPLYLTEDFRLHGVIEAYGGLFRFPVDGVMEVLPGQRIVVRFAELPPVPTTRMQLALDGGDRTPLALPRDCGRHVITVRLVSAAGTEARGEGAVAVTGCRVLPVVSGVRFAGGVLRWRTSAARSSVTLLRLSAGRWHELGARAVRGHRLSIAGRWRGRTLAAGRYRASVVAIGDDGTRSFARSVDLRVG